MKVKFCIIVILTCSCFISGAQKLARYERCWALAHPFAAIKVKLISKKCDRIYIRALSQMSTLKFETDYDKYLDRFSYGGKLDSYRHLFYMAAFAQKIKIKKIRKLGVAHEKTNYRSFLRSKTEHGELPDSLASVMDLFNNEIGLKIGSENKKLKLIELEQKVLEEIRNGKPVILKRKKNGTYLDCNDRAIDLKLYVKKWNIPKCLAPSNYVYPD